MKPTDAELEILDLLWELGSASVREIHSKLSERRDLFYTTTLKTMQLMVEKGLLTRDTSLRSHIYKPAIARKIVEKSLIDKLAGIAFKGSASKLVLSALGHANPSKKEIEEIKSLLEKLDKDEDSGNH